MNSNDQQVRPRRVRVGVIGAGLIAQVMHLPFLRELDDKFETVALCDLAPDHAQSVARRFGVGATFSSWQQLLETELDAVLVLTSGDHTPIAMAALGRGLHVLVEKPMSYGAADAELMAQMAERAGLTLMVGYQKRYDPAYLRFCDEIAGVEDARMMRITTLESPYWPYVSHYGTLAAPPLAEDLLLPLRAEADAALTRALGEAGPFERGVYENVLLASLVHELNALRGLLGEPDVLEHASLRPGSLTLLFRFGDLPVTLDRVDLPGFSGYRMEFAMYGPQRRLTLAFPSPFLRSEPTIIETEEGDAGSVRSRTSRDIVSYESAFKRELVAFHAAIVDRAPPATSGADAVRDIRLCQSIIAAHLTGRPVPHPTLA